MQELGAVRDLFPAVHPLEWDVFATYGDGLRVVFEGLPVLGAEDEAALDLVEVGGDEVFGAHGGEDVVEFGVGGFGEGRYAIYCALV